MIDMGDALPPGVHTAADLMRHSRRGAAADEGADGAPARPARAAPGDGGCSACRSRGSIRRRAAFLLAARCRADLRPLLRRRMQPAGACARLAMSPQARRA